MAEPRTKNPDEPVLYMVVRTDLAMPPGKLAAQTGHAVQLTMRASEKLGSPYLSQWEAAEYPKVCLGAKNEKALTELAEKLAAATIPHVGVRDAGRNLLEPGTLTCLGVGPWPRGALAVHLGWFQLYR